MNKIQHESNIFYANCAQNNTDKTTIAGRYAFDEGKESDIAEFITSLLRFQEHNTFLDIGCGYGNLTDYLLALGTKKKLKTTLIDIPEILNRLKADSEFSSKTTFIQGNFPSNLKEAITEKFDHILIYSVLHCVDNPENMIDEAVSLLKSGGRLLIGDVPNINKKGRFLASDAGRSFDADYKGIPLDAAPKYKDSDDFIEKNKGGLNLKISDSLITKVFNKYRQLGYNVYLIEQPASLPFSNTREDILIVKD
ncbi:MAG: class I SAM-dependent methyltransferase [Alteromonadales bacterium]|nr:class I SAM-dependent methyltransferase [Alteromonadales bacterium]MCP4986868.1 class I SAM-dependent methyltransferase [Colwellia sp.]